MQPFHPFATLYLIKNKFIKSYRLTDDEFKNKQSVYSCDIAVALYKLIPKYVPKAFKFTHIPGKKSWKKQYDATKVIGYNTNKAVADTLYGIFNLVILSN